jgi:hypothetical protein
LVAKATCLARSLLLVVEPHSMSMVPFCISGMRFCEVTDCVATFRSARPVAFLTCSTTRAQISQPKPVGWPSPPR